MAVGVKMDAFQIGVKNYDSDWLVKYGFSPQEAAGILKDWGVNFVLAQNRYLQMPDSAVNSMTLPDDDEKYTHQTDKEFRNALSEVGIKYWATVCTFFNPEAINQNPEYRPIGSDGLPMEMIDWYIGIPPSIQQFVQNQVVQIKKAVKELQPDGIFLSFTRWPGFWELWMPENRQTDFPEYSFDPQTMRLFEKDTGIKIPDLGSSKKAEWIENNFSDQWINWKCNLVVDVIRQVKEACHHELPGVKIMLNTIPFQYKDYDNAREKVFGQKIELLKDVVDIFEVMTYHQILKRPLQWMAEAGAEVKTRSDRKTVCTIQAEPLYLDGIHAKEVRSPTITDSEFREALEIIEAEGLDGVVVFVWSDLLKDVYLNNNRNKIRSINTTVAKRKQRLEKYHNGDPRP